MRAIRERFDIMDNYTNSTHISFYGAEIVAFNARKIIEGIAFACMIALENGINFIPRDTKGQWNAEVIFKRLKSKGYDILPVPHTYRDATDNEKKERNASYVIYNIEEHTLTYDDMIRIYQYMHNWAHELNPYIEKDRSKYLKEHYKKLIDNVVAIANMISSHYISIKGRGYYAVLKDQSDGLTKVISLNK